MGSNVTSLMVACSKLAPDDVGDTEIIQLLLELGAELNQRDAAGRTALHFACQAGDSQRVVFLLQWHGIDAEARTNGGDTPLMKAV